MASLNAWRRPRRLPLAKTLALMVSLSFLWPYVAFAFEPATYPRDLVEEFRYVPLTANGQVLDIKPDWGRVTSSYRGTSGKTVVFIQDLHCNYEVQSNIQSMLAEFSKQNRLRVVGVEGESTPINVEKLSKIPLAPVKDKVGQYFLQRGRITGAEYQAATGNDPLLLQGVESQALYDHNQNTLLKFLNEESQGYCQDLRFALEQLKRPVYNTDLAKMDHERESYDQENQTLEKYCDFLLAEAGRLGVELEPYKVIRLYALEHRLPVNAVVDYERLLHEAEALDRAIRQRLYTSDEQRRLDQQLYVLKIMENLINISATEEDLRYFRGHREEFTLESMLHFLEEVSYRYALQPDLDPGVLKLADYLGLAAEFYVVADQRSQAFVENLLKAMRKRGENLAVLITGGFHASHVENTLRAQGVSFLTVKPRLTRTDVANPYFSLLRNERTPLEKLLARNENIFAPRSLFNNPVFQRYMETVWEIELGRKLVLEDKLAGETLQQAFRAARGQYPADDAKVSLAFRPEQSNPANNVFVFQFEQESGYYVVVRPNATTAYTTEIGGEVLYGNNFQFQFVAAEEFAQKRADILGVEKPGQAGVLAIGRLAARLAEAANPVRRALGTLAISIGAPQGLRGLTPSALWSFIVARMNAFFRPNENLVEKAMAWSLDQYDYQANRVSRLPFRLDLEYILSVAQSDEKVRKFIGRDPGRLALAGMAFHNARQPLTGAITPTQNLEALIASFEEAEDIARQIIAGRPLEQIQIKVGLSRLAQYVQMVREGRNEFDFNADRPMNLELVLPENISKLQAQALAQLQAQHKLQMKDSHPAEAFRLLHLSAEKIGTKLSQLGEQAGMRFAFAAVSAETAMTAALPEETAAEEEIARPPLIQMGLAPLEAGAGEDATLTQIMDSATPLSRVTNGAQRQTVEDGLRLLGFQVKSDGTAVLTASRQVARVQAARRALEQEQRTMNRRLNFLTRLGAPTPAQQQERFELQQHLLRFQDAVFELGEILKTFRTSGDKAFTVLLSDQMDTQTHGHAFSIVNGDRMVLNANALNQMNSGRNRVQLMRRLAHEAGHIAGLEQTRIGEIRAGLIAKILAGYQLGIADYTAEVGKVGRRAILGEETEEAPLANVGPASEIKLTAGQRETMGTWFGEQGWTQVTLDTFAPFAGAMTAEQLEPLVPGAAADQTHQSGVQILAQLSQALAAADGGIYTGADLLEVFKLTLHGLTLNAAVTKHLADRQAYAREIVPAEFAAFETARAPIRNADQVRQMVALAFPGEEGLALTPALRLMSERIAAEEAAKFTDVNYAVEFLLDFDARAAGVAKGLPAALQPQARQYLQAALEKSLASRREATALLVEKKVQNLVQTPEEAVAALRDFARFFRVNFSSAIFTDQADRIHVTVRRRGQELLRQTAEQQAVGVFGNKAPPTREDLIRLLPADYPSEFLLSKLTADPKFQKAFPQYTSQVIWYLGRGRQAIGYEPALNQLIQAAAAAGSQRDAIRARLQQALEQIAWFFDDAAWPEVEQMVFAAYRAQYVQDLAARLVVFPEAVSDARMLASEAPLAAEFNVLAEELAALRQSQGGLNASFSRLAAEVHQQATAPLRVAGAAGKTRSETTDLPQEPVDLSQPARQLRSQLNDRMNHSLSNLPAQRDPQVLQELRDRLVAMYEKLLASEDLSANPQKQQQLQQIIVYTFERLMAQDEDDIKLPYTPHGAKHSMLVADYMVRVLNSSTIVKSNVERLYGQHAEAIVFLVGLFHDLGYAGLEQAAAELNQSVSKGYHADLGADMVRRDLAEALNAVFGMAEPGSRQGRSRLDDLLDAILLHGADKAGVKQEGEKGSGKHAYTPASETDNPLLLLTRLADNVDISRQRLRGWQTNPWFIRILHHLTNDAQLQKLMARIDLSEDEQRNQINARLIELRKLELDKLAERKALAANAAKGDLLARQKLQEQFRIQEEQDVDVLIKQLTTPNFEEEFAEIQRNLKKMNHETYFHFIGALAVRDLLFIEGENGTLTIQAVLSSEANDKAMEQAVEFQVNGPGRSNDALQSLQIAGQTAQIDVVYADGKTYQDRLNMTAGAGALYNLGVKSVELQGLGDGQTPRLALVGPRGAGQKNTGAEQTLLMADVRQSFNTALKQFQTGDYQRARLIELLDEADRQMATLVSRYGDDPTVLALEGNLAEQRRLLVQALNLNDFARNNPGFRQAVDRLQQQVQDTTGAVGWSDFLTYAAANGQIVSKGGVPHATYSNPRGDNLAQAKYAGYMRIAVINGQTVLCVDNGSSHYNRPGFRGADSEFLSSIRGLRQALTALGFNQVALFPGHALEGMTRFDPSQMVAVIDLASGKVRASKDIGAAVEIEGYETVAARTADLRTEDPAAYVDYLHSQAAAAANALRPFLADAADADAVEKYLRALTPETLRVNTTERVSGALAVHRDLGGQLQIIAERQLEGDLKNSTLLHEAVEAALRDRGIAEAHALAFVVEQELASESLRAKLNQPEHYDEAHLRNLVANTENVINAIDREPGGTAALKQRQKDNALLVARIARSVLRERQRVKALALDQRGFFGEETQAALGRLFIQFLNSQAELRSRLVKQLGVGNTFQMVRALVQRGFDLLTQEELDAFFAFFGHKAEVRAGLYTRQVLNNEIQRLRRSLQGTVFEETLNQAQVAVQSLEAGQPLTVKVNGQDRQVVDLQIRKITAKEKVSPEALNVGAFFTVEETPAGAVGFINVMAHRQMPQATLHELLETVLGIDHRLVADLEAVSEYSLGKMPFFQALTRELFWPTRVLSAIVGVIGLVGVALAVVLIFFGAAPAAAIPVMAVSAMPVVWSSATYFKQRFVITVDGPDATGKTEIGEVLSRYYGYTYADAAMYYRAFALIVKDEIDGGNWTEDAFRAETPAEQQAFATFTKIVMDRLQQADVTMFFDRSLREQRMRVFLREGGFPGRRREITDQILPAAANASSAEFQRIEALASQLGQIPAVQRVVDDHLRALAKRENLVAVGQTMGTKLFDRDAQMRFYVVNNDLRNRAERLLRRPLRTEEELTAGLAEIENMDLSARTRQRDPLRPIPDAVVLDTGNFALADVLKTARQSITRRSEVIRNAFVWIASLVRDRHRMMNRIQGETARRQVLEQMGDVWLGFSDIDGLSGYNLIYGKAITNYLLEDVLGIIEETANARPVRQIVDRNRRVYRQMLLQALFTLNFRQALRLIVQLSETRVTTIKHGGDEGLYLIPEFFSPRDVGEIMKQFRSRVLLSMHRQFKPYEVLGLKPAEEQQLRAIADKINEDYGDPKLVRVAYDEVYGVRVLLRVGRSDLAKRFQQELRGFAPLAEGQINGNLVELVLKKRLEEAGLQAAQVENLNLTQMAWPQVTEGFKPPLDQKGYGYLQEGYLLTPTLSIGATKASRVDYSYVEKHEAGALTRSEVQAWSEALYQLAGDFLHQAKDAGKNQVVVDQLQEPIRREEKAPEAPVLGPAHSRQLQRQQLLFEDNLVLRTGERPKHDAIYPKHFSTDGFRELVRQRLAVLAGRSDFQPEIHVSRAPPDSGPDKVHIAVITPETTYLLELEGQYYGPFVEQAREILRQRMAKEWSEQQQRPLEEVLADPNLARTLEETMASYVTATQDGTTYFRFKLLNDTIGYTAGDQTIGLPHMILDQLGLSLLRQPGRMLRKLPAVLNELEREMNDPRRGNQVRVALTAVFSEMPTKQAFSQGIGRLFSDLQVASMAKQGRITTYHPTLRKPALVKQMEAAVKRLRNVLAEPDAQRRMVEEVEAAEKPQPRRFKTGSFFTMLFSLMLVAFLGTASPDLAALEQPAPQTSQTDTELMAAESGAQATRSYGAMLDGRSRQVSVPAEAGNRRIQGYQTMRSPLGSHVVLLLEKSAADIEQVRAAKARALQTVQQQIDRLLGQEEPAADGRELKMWRALASTLAALEPAAVQLQAAVVLEGRELGAYWDNGTTYLPARHLGEPELLAYDLVHENLHPAIRAAYGQLGNAPEEALVLQSGVKAFGPMINVSLGFDNGLLGISVNSIDPNLRMDNPEVEQAIQGALLAAWRQVLEQRARGARVDQDYANALSREMERRGMAIPTSLRARPGEGGFITPEAAGLLAGIAAAIAGIAGIAATGTVTLLTGGLAAAGILAVLGVGAWVARRQPLRSLLAKAGQAFNWAAFVRLAKRAADFIRGNPMIIVAVAAGLYALLNPQPAEGGTMMMAAGALGIAGINRETPIRDAYKIASRYTVERRMAKMISHLEGAGMAVAQVDSFGDLKKIYGADIAAFAYEKSLQIIQHFLGKRGSLFRYENLEGSFGYMAHNANEANLTALFKEIQTYLFQSFNRRYRVVTLPNAGLDSQGQPLPERDLGVRLTQLRTLVTQYGRGAVGITKGNRIHVVYEISSQSDLQHALQVAGILNAKQPSDSLAAMSFENEALVGLHQGFLYVPKLNVGIAAETVYDQALAELPGKVELRTLLPGEQIVSRMTKSAYYAAKNQARAIGGAIVVAREFAPEAEPQAEAVAEEFELEPEMILFNFNLRNDQIFQRWFISTTNDIVEQSEDKLEAFDTLRQLYESNQEMIEQEEFDYLGHIFMQARRLIEEMRQMGHYALPEAERKFADITLLWESRYGETAMNQFFARRPELLPAMKALEEAIRPVEREQDLAKLRSILRSFIEEKDLQVMATPGRVKHPFSILMNFLRYWNRAIKFMPDFTDLAFYHERNVRKVSDDVIGTMLVIPELQEMERAVNALIPYLEARGLRIKTEEGKKIKGVNLTVTAAADGTYRIQPKQEGYYDVKIKIAPTMEMPFGAEIKILPDFIDESATRPGYTLIKQAVLKEVNWTIAMGGPSGTGKLEAARTLAKGLNYQVIDIGLIFRGVYAAAVQFVKEGKADDLHSVFRRSIIRLTDEGVKVGFGRKNVSRTEIEVSREQAMAVEPKLDAEQTRQLNQVVQRVVTHFAKGGRLVVVGQDPFAYLPQADVKIYFDLSSEERQARGTKSWEELPAPKDALNISSDIQQNAGGVVRLIEQMIADAILTRGLGKSPYARMSGRTGYQALSLRNTLVVAAIWIGILSLGLGMPFLPALGIGLLYPSAKIVAAARLLAAKYGFPGILKHWGEPVGAYDPQLEKMVDPATGRVLGEAEWPIAWHEGFSHAAVQRALRFIKIDLAALRPGTLRRALVAGLAEFATHTLDALTAPLAFARLRTGPRWDAVVLSGVFLTSGLMLAASFFVALPAAVPLALAAVFAIAGLSVAWIRGALAPAATASPETAAMDLAEGQTNLTDVLDQVRTEQRLGVAAQPATSAWQRLQVRIRESGLGRALNQLRGMPAGLKLLMLLPKPQTNAWAKAAVIGASLAVWAGVSLALVNTTGVELAANVVLLSLAAMAPGHAFSYRLRTTAASPFARAIANSPWMEQTALALNRSENSVQVSILLQELLGVLNEAKDDPQAREAVLEVLASLPALKRKTATLQMADGSQSTHQLPAVVFEKPNLFLRLKRVFPVITIDNQPQDLPQPRQQRTVGSAA